MAMILAIMFIPPLLFILIGLKSEKNSKKSKTAYILAIIYLIVGFGLCGDYLF
ncbi:hypothetical protein [Olleya sp. R77988]|uniref:hypothetical protein n=1 Tax=Olleya sp. R77988 TaxID=3093875 RepID=UPI0037C908D9